MKILRLIGSLTFVLGLFIAIFAGIIWAVIVSVDPVVPLWLRIAVFSLMGGILLVLFTVALEQKKIKTSVKEIPSTVTQSQILLLNTSDIPGQEIKEILGLVKGNTIFAIWLGNDLSALVRLVLGGELIEYTTMMGKARKVATDRMIVQAEELGADAIINLRYMTTSIVGSAAEFLAYGTAVKLKN